ncbi:MAG: hypothetical protein HC831_16825 [Chloroflexia bacterium]|nr:hypothetical protein [Chloroflexia bacterium]
MDIIKEDYDAKESPRFGYGFNLGVNFQVNDWFRIKTGIGIKNIGEKVEYLPILELFEYGNYIIPIYADKKKTENNKYVYLSFPIDFEIVLLQKKQFSFGVIAGSDIDFLIKGSLADGIKKSQTELKYKSSEFPKLAANIHGGLVTIIKLNESLICQLVRNLPDMLLLTLLLR